MRPDSSIALSARSVSSGSRRSTAFAAPACTTITLMLCATTSWSSRAIRLRSSATASRAATSRSRSSRRRRFHTIRPIANGRPTVKNALLAISTQLGFASAQETADATMSAPIAIVWPADRRS